MKDYLALTKPRITWLILMSTGVGYFFGVKGPWNWIGLLHTILGTGLICSGTAALNQWYERDSDAKMHRTQGRPLPAGRLEPANAFLFAVVISLAGFVELTFPQAGSYPFVSHYMVDAERGAHGMFKVTG